MPRKLVLSLEHKTTFICAFPITWYSFRLQCSLSSLSEGTSNVPGTVSSMGILDKSEYSLNDTGVTRLSPSWECCSALDFNISK